MADIEFAPTKSGSSEVLVGHATGMTLEANKIDVDLAVRYHDHCLGVQRAAGFEHTLNNVIIPSESRNAVREMGIMFADNKSLVDAVSTPDGKAKVEGMIKDYVAPMLDNFCIATDAVEVRHLKTDR